MIFAQLGEAKIKGPRAQGTRRSSAKDIHAMHPEAGRAEAYPAMVSIMGWQGEVD